MTSELMLDWFTGKTIFIFAITVDLACKIKGVLASATLARQQWTGEANLVHIDSFQRYICLLKHVDSMLSWFWSNMHSSHHNQNIGLYWYVHSLIWNVWNIGPTYLCSNKLKYPEIFANALATHRPGFFFIFFSIF